jgi:DNA-binding transcriptional MocR family regulator
VGLFVSVALPDDVDEAALLGEARERGLALDGGNEHTVPEQPPGLALGFGAAPEPTLARAVKALAAAAHSC